MLAEIPGVDPVHKDEVVVAAGHLDSWSAGTGATDDGAGVVIVMEAMRILRALAVRPARTIRVALWTGEEQGALGSLSYVNRHIATIPRVSTPEQSSVPEFWRRRSGPVDSQARSRAPVGDLHARRGRGPHSRRQPVGKRRVASPSFSSGRRRCTTWA